MTDPFLREERRGAVTVLTMNGPEDRNALSSAWQCEEFVEVCRRINADHGVKVVILTGRDPAFCSGGNIKHMRSLEGFMAGRVEEVAEGYRATLQQLALSLYELQVPVIAAVNGPAIGAGLDIACMCDVRIASDRACFSEAFVRLGLISGIGGAWFLPRIVGASRAAELSFTARVVDAAQALEYGLVSEVLAADRLMARAHALAEEIAQHPGPALRFCKRLLRRSDGSDLRTSLDMTAALQAIAHQTPEHHLAVERFLAGRERGSRAAVASMDTGMSASRMPTEAME